MTEKKNEKRPSKIFDYEEKREKKDRGNYTFGQLKFGEYPDAKNKLTLRTFFGNPETQVFCVRFDQDDQFVAGGNLNNCLNKPFSSKVNIHVLVNQVRLIKRIQYNFKQQVVQMVVLKSSIQLQENQNTIYLGKIDEQIFYNNIKIQNLKPKYFIFQKLVILALIRPLQHVLELILYSYQRWRPPIHNKTKQVLVSVNSDGSIIHWHAPTGKQLHRLIENNHSIMCLDYNADGSAFVTAGKDFHIRIYDEDTKSVSTEFKPADWNYPGHSNRVFATKFLQHDSNLILSGGWDSNVHLWDIREKKSVAAIYGPSLSGDSLDYKDGLILTGSYRNDNQLQLWDLKTRKLFKDIEWSPGNSSNQVYLYSSQFSKIDNKTIMAGSSGVNEFLVFDALNEYKPSCGVVELRDGVYGVDYGNVTNKVAFGGGEGVVYVLTVSKQV